MDAKVQYFSYNEFVKVMQENGITCDKEYRHFRAGFDEVGYLPTAPSKVYSDDWFGWVEIVLGDATKRKATFIEFCDLVTENKLTHKAYVKFQREYVGPVTLSSKPSAYYLEFTCWEDIRPNMQRRFATYDELCLAANTYRLTQRDYTNHFKDFDTEEYIFPRYPRRHYKEFQKFSVMKGSSREKIISYSQFCKVIYESNRKSYVFLRASLDLPLPRYPGRAYKILFEGYDQVRDGDGAYLCIGYQEFKDLIISESVDSHCYLDFYNKHNLKAEVGSLVPACPEKCYGVLWEGWDVVLVPGHWRKILTYKQFKKAVVRNDIDEESYKGLIKVLPLPGLMPDHPELYYDDWEGWGGILGQPQKASFEEFRGYVRKNKIKAADYQSNGPKIRKDFESIHSRKFIPSNPKVAYPEYTNWRNLLGGENYVHGSANFPDYTMFVSIIKLNNVAPGSEYKIFRVKYEGEYDLPSEPYVTYKGDLNVWPISGKFTREGRLDIIETKKICRDNNIRKISDYGVFRRENPDIRLATEEVVRRLTGYISKYNLLGVPYPDPKEAHVSILKIINLISLDVESISSLSKRDYKKLSGYDDGLVSDPVGHYGLKDWDAFTTFEFYSLEEVREYCISHQIGSKAEYVRHQENNPFLSRIETYAKNAEGYTKSIFVYKDYFLTNCDENYVEWAKFASEWIKSQSSQPRKRQLIKGFIQSVLVSNGLESNVGAYFYKDSEHGSLEDVFNDLADYFRKKNSLVDLNSYLDFCLEKTCGDRDSETKELVIVDGYYNPFLESELDDLDGRSYSRSESNKPMLPYDKIVEIQQFLLPSGARDFSDLVEAKNFFDNDWYYVDEEIIDKTDPDCVWRKSPQLFPKKEYQVWFPGTTIANALLFYTPHRGRQIVLCDSGEADVYQLVSKDVFGKKIYEWVPNENSLVSLANLRTTRPSQGVLLKLEGSLNLDQQLVKQEMKWNDEHGGMDGFKVDVDSLCNNVNAVGLHTTTNKTATLSKGGHSTPYIPEQLIPWLIKLRDWQSKYNSLQNLTSWLEIKSLAVRESHLRSRPKQTFLFRDATSALYSNLPMSTQRVFGKFACLLSRVQTPELPLAERNYETKSEIGRGAWVSKYTPHCLRVSLISAYILDGNISIHVIRKMVGHHSLVMTLYYTKMGQGEIRQQFTEAEEKMLAMAPERIKKLAYDRNIESIKSEFTSLYPSVLNSISNNYPFASYGFMDIGVCMQTCTGCSEGGELDEVTNIRLPLPKGYRSKNCSACRFFLTGPAFISGLQALQNEILIASEDASERMEGFLLKKQEVESLIYQHRTNNPNQVVPLELTLKLNKFQMAYQHEIETVDVCASDITRIHLLVRKSVAILNENISTDGVQLVAVAEAREVEAVMEDCSNIRLYYEGIKNGLLYTSINPKEAVEKAIRAISRVTEECGIHVPFYKLNQEQRLLASKQLLELLLKACNYSWEELDNVVKGDLRLEDLSDGQQLVVLNRDMQEVIGVGSGILKEIEGDG